MGIEIGEEEQMQKQKRLKILSKIIQLGKHRNHATLLKELKKNGILSSQSSISRDLLDLAVIKRRGIYFLPEEKVANKEITLKRLSTVWKELVQKIVTAGQSFLVVKTISGSANTIAHYLDNLNWKEIAGTVAGDDTIFIVTPEQNDQKRLIRRLNELNKNQ